MELEKENSIKVGRRLKLIRYSGKNSKKFLKFGKIYFIRKVNYDEKGRPHSIFVKNIGKRFGLSNFELLFNKYDWINWE